MRKILNINFRPPHAYTFTNMCAYTDACTPHYTYVHEIEKNINKITNMLLSESPSEETLSVQLEN